MEIEKPHSAVSISYSLSPQERPASRFETFQIPPAFHAISARYAPTPIRPSRLLASLTGVGRFRPADSRRTTSIRPRPPRPPVRQAPPVMTSGPMPVVTAIPLAAAVSTPSVAVKADLQSGVSLSEPVSMKPDLPSVAKTPPPENTASAPLLSVRGVSKSFGPVRAVDAVSLDLRSGEKHALLGENGAGKSTLVKMIYGVLQPDSGTISLDGRALRIDSPSMARRQGIGMVFQHFSTFEALSVAENLAVVLPDRSLRDIRRDVKRIGGEYGLGIEPDRRLVDLSAGERQRVEIIRCLLQNPRLLIMDEPTSVLTPQEAEALFVVLNRLAGEGCAILYISHRLEDVRALCTSATVMRRGKVVATCDPREQTAASLAKMMIGSTVEHPRKQAAYIGKPLLEVSDLSVPSTNGMALDGITFAARKGEILGIAGVAGEGQSELFAALSGERILRRNDTIRVDGRAVGKFDSTRRRRAGMAFAPERRIGHSAIGDMRLSENFRLTHNATGIGRNGAQQIREDFDVRAEGRDPFASALSGGNLQKFVIGREIMRDPAVLIVEQPTWGVDAGAAATIHEALMALSAKGAAIVVISQDLDEIFAICDRVAVLHRGRLSEPQVTGTVTAEALGLLMGGVEPTALAEAI